MGKTQSPVRDVMQLSEISFIWSGIAQSCVIFGVKCVHLIEENLALPNICTPARHLLGNLDEEELSTSQKISTDFFFLR